MSIHTWHLFGVAVPYVMIATALWGLGSGAVKDAVRVGSLPDHAPVRLGRHHFRLPTVPLAYGLGFTAVAFIYGCALDRNHMGIALGADPHALAPGADLYLYGLAVASWLSAAVLIIPYRRLRRGTRSLLAAGAAKDRAETRYRVLAENLTDLVSQHEPDGRYEWLSASVESILGYRAEELVGRDPYDLFHPDDIDRIRSESHDRVRHGAESNALVRYRIRRKDGRYIWLESLTESLRDDEGQIVGLQVTSRDVTERQAIEDELQQRAHYDQLTGLANRVLFTLRLDALIEAGHSVRSGSFAVLYIDLDRFKSVNDRMGHAAGDDLLVQIAGRLRSVTRDGDTIARIGGDEFAVLLSGMTSEAHALETAQRIEDSLQVPFNLGGAKRTVTASVGVVLGRTDHGSAGEVLREADLAAYAVKGRGRAGSALFTPALREASDRRLRLEADLERAIENQELRVAYQPIVRLTDGHLVGVEALLRWQHPELGLLSPAAFISIAEETGRIYELDLWVMAAALEQLHAWDAEAGRTLDLSVNVNCSAHDIDNPSFTEHVHEILASGPRRAERLVIEVTESLVVDDVARVASVLHSLREEGVRFAMDDFGTGYSSLSAVHALPVDTIKIDREFVRRMHEDASSREMVKTILGFARTMEAGVVAEGIEAPEQLAALVALGCELGQGFLFERPVPPEVISDRIAQRGSLWVGLAETAAAAA